MEAEANQKTTNSLEIPSAQPVSPSARQPVNSLRAWLYLVWLGFQRQARARQMVWIALALLGLTVMIVALNTAAGRWSIGVWRWSPPAGQASVYPVPRIGEWLTAEVQGAKALTAGSPVAAGLADAILGIQGAFVDRSGLLVFSRALVWSIFLSFLLPIWSLSFATEALGGERESGSLIWLLTRPLPRPAVYLAKFFAFLPWALALNLGGFAIMCLAAGDAGRDAFGLYWTAVLGATLAFGSLFHLMSAFFRRPAVIAIVYSFFLESFLGNMPGYMKRISIGYYGRCIMFESAEQHGLPYPEVKSVYLPVDAATAWWVLAGITVGCLLIGMWVFARAEYRPES